MGLHDMQNISRNLKISILLVFTGFAIHFIGFVSPYWNVLPENDKLESTESIIRLGLWRVCYRHGQQLKCTSHVFDLAQVTAAKVLETFSVAFFLLSLTTFWLYRRHPVYGAKILLSCIVLDVLTAQSTSIGALCWVTIKEVHDKYKLSWAFGLIVGSVIFPLLASWFVSQERKDFLKHSRRSSLETSDQLQSCVLEHD